MRSETLVTHGADTAGNLVTVTTTIERTPPTVFGVAPPGTEMPQHHTVYGTLGYPRFFFGDGKLPGWDLFPLRNLQPGDVPVVSAKTWYPDAFRTMLDDATAEDWLFCYIHEPENQFAAGTLTANAYAATWEEIRTIRDEHPRGSRCRLAVIFSWYALAIKHFDWRRLGAAIDCADIVGVDCYAPLGDLNLNVYPSPAVLFGPPIEIAAATGLPWAVPEFGVRIAPDGNKARHAAQVQAYADYARVHGAQWVSLWCNPGGGYMPHWCTDPLYDQALGVWKAAMNGS
jgi:hypothetical protein